MKVFISWSGERSKLVAELLDDWIQCVIQAVNPWMSSKDIDRGSLWFSEITDQLSNTGIGIICLTKENKEKPWILFEAGALAKGLTTTRICTFLIDLEPSDVGNPLAQFNHTFPVKESVWELVRTLNNILKENALKEKILNEVFNTYWPKFEKDFQEILKITKEGKIEKRSEDEILMEILSSTRTMERRIRSLESNNILAPKLQRHPHHIDSYDEAEKFILNLFDENLPNEIILDISEDKGIPSDFVEDILRRRKRKRVVARRKSSNKTS